MDRMVHISKYQPGFMKEVKEFQILAEIENPELVLLWQEAENAFFDQFVETLTEEGCRRWEKILKIASKASDTLEMRRFQILIEINASIPYTFRGLEKTMDSICGEHGYTLELAPNEYVLIVRVSMKNREKYDAVKKMLDWMVPSNMIIDYSLLYNRHRELKPYHYGAFEPYTHMEIREREIPFYTLYSKLKKQKHKELKTATYKWIKEEAGTNI